QDAIKLATATAGLAPTTSEDDADQILPEDNPWLTVAEEETGTKPPILSRLWQSHVSPPGTTVVPTPAAPRPGHPQGDAPTMDEAAPQVRPSMVGVPFTGTLVG